MLRQHFENIPVLRRLFYILCIALLLMTAISSVAVAEEVAEAAIETEAETLIINTQLIATIDPTITVKLDGETLQSTEVHRSEKGGLYVNAMPIFTALGNDFEYDDVSKALIVRRSQDGVVMELYTDTGIVKANGKALGKLDHFGEVAQGKYILTPNAIAVLSGANGAFNDKTKEFNFKLDPRLRVATGFEISVNGLALRNLNPAPKSIGPVLLLPLLPIAEELGHDVQVIEGGSEVRVRRAQDSAVFTLNLETGLVKLRDKPYGITKDVAYIDPTNLLLPVSAVETLTGTHVAIDGATGQINIDLDDRLTGAITPSSSVDEEAKNTPFTPESVSFHLGPDTLNTVDFDFRYQRVNGRVRYEIPDLPENAKEVEPSWLSLEFAHTNGVKGSIGDYAANLRELDGIGLRRIRGVAGVKQTEKGRWAAAIGMPSNGAERISEDQSRLTYGGIAAGVRFASLDGWEAGGAIKKDSLTNDQMAVLSAISGRLGRKDGKKLQWDARGDIGAFSGPAREKAVDIRASINSRYDVSEVITVDSFVEYDGAEFLRSNLDAEDREDDISDILSPNDDIEELEEAIPDIRRRGIDQVSLGGSVRYNPKNDFGFLKDPAASVRVQHNKSGFLTGGDIGSNVTSYGGAFAASLGETGVSLTVDANSFTQSFADDRDNQTGRQFSARAYKTFDFATVRAQYTNSKRNDEKALNILSGSVSSRSYNLPMPKNASLSVAPSVSGFWSDEDKALRGGVVANFNSGQILGSKTRIDASLGVLQSFSGRQGNQSDQFLTVSVARKVRLGKNMALGLAYRNDLNGNQRIGLQLDGRFDFNEKRKYKSTKDGRGVLKGQTFLDKNRDGIKQDDEPAVPRTMVRVKGTRLALRSDNTGHFTIQNIKEGLYEIQIDGKTLPIGYALSEDIKTRVTIHDGQITDIPLPIVQRGQIRGFAFVDDNGDGEYTKGEERIEGAKLVLKSKSGDAEDAVAFTTSFGQYAFDDLPADEYEISVAGNEKTKIWGIAPGVINLTEHEELMGRMNIPLIRKRNIQLADSKATDPPDKTGNTMVTVPEGPAPP